VAISQLIVNSLILGSIYSLLALGFTMVYGILKLINFAHGAVFMVGGYAGYVLTSNLGWHMAWSLPVVFVLCGLIGIGVERVAFRPLRDAPMLNMLITSIGVAIVLQNLIALIFGADARSITQGGIREGLLFFGARITVIQIVIVILTVGLMVALSVFLKFTRLGKATRATSEDRELAAVRGISTDRVIAYIFFISSAFGGVGGFLVGLDQTISPPMGIGVGIKGFVAAIVGGIGNPYGAMLGGVLLGVFETLSIWYFPAGYKDGVAFLLLIILLLFIPGGFIEGFAKLKHLVRKKLWSTSFTS
jgi:branched-chain amino acid transport system permease protein